MKTCACGGDLLRHGVTKYGDGSQGVRYRCRECSKTFTERNGNEVRGLLFFNSTGRPTKKDWRHGVPA